MPRIFVAIPIPSDIAVLLARAIPASPALRPVAAESLHVTLAFIGAIGEERVGEVSAAAARAASSGAAFDVVLGPLERFSASGTLSVIWAGLGTAAPDVEALGAALRGELESRNVAFDRKPLRPHVTLARLRERTAPAEIASVSAALEAAVMGPLSFRATAVHVVESRLGRTGASYATRSEHSLLDSRRV